VRLQGGQIESTTYVEGVFEHHRRGGSGGVRENNTLHVMDDRMRVATMRVGEPFPDDVTPALTFNLADHLGSAHVIADRAGHLVNREEFTPYGETAFGSFSRKRYRYAGKERDEESGLCYYGARYGMPWLARWASADPEGLPGGINLFVFAADSPVRFTDPEGRKPRPANAGGVHAVPAKVGVTRRGMEWNDNPVVIGSITTEQEMTRREVFVQGLIENISYEELPNKFPRLRAEAYADAALETSFFIGGAHGDLLPAGTYPIMFGQHTFASERKKLLGENESARQMQMVKDIGEWIPGADIVVEAYDVIETYDREGFKAAAAAAAVAVVGIVTPGPNVLKHGDKLPFDVWVGALKRWKVTAGQTSSGITDQVRQEAKDWAKKYGTIDGPPTTGPVHAGHVPGQAHVLTPPGEQALIAAQTGPGNLKQSAADKATAARRRELNAAHPNGPQLPVRPKGMKRTR
jgi:RHS repeat-associated protein